MEDMKANQETFEEAQFYFLTDYGQENPATNKAYMEEKR